MAASSRTLAVVRDNLHATDLYRLAHIEALSVLSRGDLALLADALVVDTFKRREIILREEALASESHILLKGVAVITCLNARNQRITVAMLAPGPIPEFPLLPSSRWDFQCEAYAGCRVAMLGWEQFPFISAVVSCHATVKVRLTGNSWISLDLAGNIWTKPA
jgi:hypothetical protein